MRITTKGRYALRAMTNLALSSPGKPKAIKTIAAEEEISPEFLEQIFFKLKKASIIDSVRGPGGGFILSIDPALITVKAIFIAVEEGLDLTPCTSCTDDQPEIVCDRVDDCLVHDVWKEASNHISAFFEGITLQRIVNDNKARPGANNNKLDALLAGKNVLIN